METSHRQRPGHRPAVRALMGVSAAVAALGVGHGIAANTRPAASPLVAVGSALVDLAPTPVKDFAVRTLGTADKPVLIAGTALVLCLLAAALGLIAPRRRGLAAAGGLALGVIGVVAVLMRSADPVGVVAPLSSALVAAAALWLVGTVLSDHRSPTGAGSKSVPAGTTPDGATPAGATPAKVSTLRRPDRRTFLVGSGLLGLGASGAAAGFAGDAASARPRGPIALPRPVSPAPALPPGVQVEGASGFVTPNRDFYRVDVSLVTPHRDLDGWALTVDGEVDRPLRLTYAELLDLPMIERDITLACVSNEVGGPYVGTARWLGVPFREIIARAGVRPGVDQVLSHSFDSGYTASTPYAAVSDGRDAMVAIAMNGEPLPDANGFPARMVVPGLFGFVSATKWLERLEFTRYATREAYWTTRGWATDAPTLVQSRIDVPRPLGELPRGGAVLAGVAWAQHRGIARVEVRIDGGAWQDARLAADAGIDLWRQWTFVYDGPPGRHSATVRATEVGGRVQPEARTPVFPSGATGWHTLSFVVR